MIVLCSRAALPMVIAQHDPEMIISAVGRGETVPTPTDRCSTIHLAFNDVQHDHGPWRAPTARHVERLGEAVSRWSRRRPLVVHCHEGRSRAPAVVLAVMCYLGIDPAHAVVRLLSTAPWVKPHVGFLRLVDAAMGDIGLTSTAMRHLHGFTHSSMKPAADHCSATVSLWGCRERAGGNAGPRVEMTTAPTTEGPCGPAAAGQTTVHGRSSTTRGSFPDGSRARGGRHAMLR